MRASTERIKRITILLILGRLYEGQKINGHSLYYFNPPYTFLKLCKITKLRVMNMKTRHGTGGVNVTCISTHPRWRQMFHSIKTARLKENTKNSYTNGEILPRVIPRPLLVSIHSSSSSSSSSSSRSYSSSFISPPSSSLSFFLCFLFPPSPQPSLTQNLLLLLLLLLLLSPSRPRVQYLLSLLILSPSLLSPPPPPPPLPLPSLQPVLGTVTRASPRGLRSDREGRRGTRREG
ncbi:hypothetical protein E2C01_011597 [Portunus trituberculatus]|uniref:Uncharacterized protein n=1 Tax=Portunus trituberculatus TaxID=210409 RepID=A0A5B7DBH7_PORTR|nr:hypothetical protein [Portunus trituberculatus]